MTNFRLTARKTAARRPGWMVNSCLLHLFNQSFRRSEPPFATQKTLLFSDHRIQSKRKMAEVLQPDFSLFFEKTTDNKMVVTSASAAACVTSFNTLSFYDSHSCQSTLNI